MLTVAIVNDVAIAVEALYRAISVSSKYRLLWVARTGTEAVRRCLEQPPDLILMDLNMPELDGAEATRQIMQHSPCAILIVTASVTNNTAKVFEAMGHGALDAVTTPALGTGDPEAVQMLLKKMATVAHFCRRSPRVKRLDCSQFPTQRTAPPSGTARSGTTDSGTAGSGTARTRSARTRPARTRPVTARFRDLPPLIVIGTSTGGPNALQQILSQLPTPAENPLFKAAIIVIQHIDGQFAPGLVAWLDQCSRLPVTLAGNGDRPEAGRVLIAGTNDHLILRSNLSLRYVNEPANLSYRPSVDVFFHSVARHWPVPGSALLLTGMGQDGAEGMALLQSAHWNTIAESDQSCVAFGMPKSAIDRGAANHILPLEAISPYLVRTLTNSN